MGGGRRGVAAIVSAAGTSALAYAAAVRPRINRWGATDDELADDSRETSSEI